MQPLKLIKKDKVLQYVLIIGLIGVALLTLGDILDLSSPGNRDLNKNIQPAFQNINTAAWKDEYEAGLEKDLAQILERIKGVGRVKVDVTLDTSFEHHYLYNENSSNRRTEEEDSSGGTRVIQETSEDREVIVVSTNQGEEPLIKNKDFPRIKGVLVVAEGAEKIKIKANLIYAIRTLLDIPLNKIMVLPYQER